MRRTWMIGAAAAAVVSILGIVRYATFDPDSWAEGVADEVSPFSMSTVSALKGIARDDAGIETLGTLDMTEMKARADRFAKTTSALRARFHGGGGYCARWGSSDPPAKERAPEIAEAIVDAGLARDLDGLMWARMKWDREADETHHEVTEADELFAYFSKNANPWTRVGLIFRGGEARGALEKTRVSKGRPVSLAPEKEPRAKALWERYGAELVPGVMAVTPLLGHVDLSAARLRSIAPDMTRAQVHQRLGDGVTTGADEEQWTKPDVGVAWENDRVLAVATSSLDRVDDGTHPLYDVEETAITEHFGPPLWTADTPDGREVVYTRGAFRQRLIFAPLLVRVELWTTTRLTPPASPP